MSNTPSLRSVFPKSETYSEFTFPSKVESLKRMGMKVYPNIVKLEFPYRDPLNKLFIDAFESSPPCLHIPYISSPEGMTVFSLNFQIRAMVDDVLHLQAKYKVPKGIVFRAPKAGVSMKYDAEISVAVHVDLVVNGLHFSLQPIFYEFFL